MRAFTHEIIANHTQGMFEGQALDDKSQLATWEK